MSEKKEKSWVVEATPEEQAELAKQGVMIVFFPRLKKPESKQVENKPDSGKDGSQNQSS